MSTIAHPRLVIGAALAVVAGAVASSHLPLQSLWHPAGWLLVVGGTLCATSLSHSPTLLWQALTQLGRSPVDWNKQLMAATEQLVNLAQGARKSGLLTLQHQLPALQQTLPLSAEGLAMVLDNVAADHVRSRLSATLESTYQHRQEEARVLEVAAGYAPTMGLMGALLGLMQTLHLPLTQPEVLATGVASAFSATLLGLGLANLLLLPLAHRLRHQARQSWTLDMVQLTGVLAIQQGQHPVLVKEKLLAYLQPDARPLQQAPSPAAPTASTPETLGIPSRRTLPTPAVSGKGSAAEDPLLALIQQLPDVETEAPVAMPSRNSATRSLPPRAASHPPLSAPGVPGASTPKRPSVQRPAGMATAAASRPPVNRAPAAARTTKPSTPGG